MAFIGLLALSLGLAACDTADPIDTEPTIAALLAQTPDLSTLDAAVAAADLRGTLDAPGNMFTVFAPTNAAFDAVFAATGLTPEELLGSDALVDILLFHVVTGRLMAGDISAGETLVTARPEGASTITVVAADGGLGIDTSGDGVANALITATDIVAANGVVHLIDAVLVPADIDLAPDNLAGVVAGRDDLTVLTTALGATGLDAVLADDSAEFTVFAPTDAAFVALLDALEITAEELLALEGIDGVLLYHVIAGTVLAGDLAPGQVVTTARPAGVATFTVVAVGDGFGIDVTGDGSADALITEVDIAASNGAVHIIDSVLVPTDFLD